MLQSPRHADRASANRRIPCMEMGDVVVLIRWSSFQIQCSDLLPSTIYSDGHRWLYALVGCSRRGECNADDRFRNIVERQIGTREQYDRTEQSHVFDVHKRKQSNHHERVYANVIQYNVYVTATLHCFRCMHAESKRCCSSTGSWSRCARRSLNWPST